MNHSDEMTPRLDGLYMSPNGDYASYLRFTSSGRVSEAGSTGKPAEVARWLGPGNTDLSQGTYLVQGGKLHFTTSSPSGRVAYEGQITRDATKLHLRIHSYINGRQREDVYTFVPLSNDHGGHMIDASIQEYLESGFESMYSGKWKPISSAASIIETDEIGILVIHDREYQHLAFATSVLDGVRFSPELVRDVGRLNHNIVLGAYVLSEGQPGYWWISYAIKLRYNWLDRSTASAQLILDSLKNVPEFANLAIRELSPKFGGEPSGISGGWWLALMDNF